MISIKFDSMVFYSVGRNLEIEMNNLMKSGHANESATKMVPMIVNYAFSDELALKYILCKNNINYKKEHQLMYLFMLIPKKIYDYVVNNIAKLINNSTEVVESELLKLSNFFVEWRYFYEGGSKSANIVVLSRFSYLLNQYLKYENNMTDDEILGQLDKIFTEGYNLKETEPIDMKKH